MGTVTTDGDGQGLPDKVKGLMKGITDDLIELVKIRSIYDTKDPKSHEADLDNAATTAQKLLQKAGLTQVDLVEIGGGARGSSSTPSSSTAPTTARTPGPTRPPSCCTRTTTSCRPTRPSGPTPSSRASTSTTG
ncbi:hypothetical protein GCM10010519_20550 [Streptomyces lactacystinicus]